MLTFCLLILCINIDALSYGVANGVQNRKFSVLYILLVCVMSTIMFAVPLYLSKYVFQYFDELICRIINGIILMLLGFIYILPKNFIKKLFKNKKTNYSQNTKNSTINTGTTTNIIINNFNENQDKNNENYIKNSDNCLKTTKNINATSKNNKKRNQNSNNNELNSDSNTQKYTKISFGRCFFECFVISVDAIFTAFLSNFTDNYYIFAVAFYAITNYLAIYLGNRALYKINKLVKFNLSFLSGLIFILLGVLKICGF